MSPRSLLDSDEVRRWLGGIVPAWTLLEPDNFTELVRPPSAGRSAIKLATDLSKEEPTGSAMLRNALVVLEAVAKPRLLRTFR